MKIIEVVREYHNIQYNLNDRIYRHNIYTNKKMIRIFQYIRIMGITNKSHRDEFYNLNFMNLTSINHYTYISISQNKLLISVNDLGHGLRSGKEVILDLNDSDIELVLKDASGILRMDMEDNEKYFRGHGYRL